MNNEVHVLRVRLSEGWVRLQMSLGQFQIAPNAKVMEELKNRVAWLEDWLSDLKELVEKEEKGHE